MHWELVVLAGCLSLLGPSLHDLSHPSPIRATPREPRGPAKRGRTQFPGLGWKREEGVRVRGDVPVPTPAKPKAGLLLPPPSPKGTGHRPLWGWDPLGAPLASQRGKGEDWQDKSLTHWEGNTPQTPGLMGIWGVLQEKGTKFYSNTSGARETRLQHGRGL